MDGPPYDANARCGPGTSSVRGFSRFIGVSLGGGRGKTTAVSRLELADVRPAAGDDHPLVLREARVRREHRGAGESGGGQGPFRDPVLLDYLQTWVDDRTLVAIDAPMTMPPCVRCQLACPGVDACEVPDVVWMRTHAPNLVRRPGRRDAQKPYVTPYTQRVTELVMERATLQPREALGQGMGPLAARASYLRRVLSPTLRLNENLIETHPRATLIRAFGSAVERGTRQGETLSTWEVRKDLLIRLAERSTVGFDRVWPELVVRNVHVFGAVVCALTALLWDRHRWRGPADLMGQDEALDRALEALGDDGPDWRTAGWIWAPPRSEQ